MHFVFFFLELSIALICISITESVSQLGRKAAMKEEVKKRAEEEQEIPSLFETATPQTTKAGKPPGGGV